MIVIAAITALAAACSAVVAWLQWWSPRARNRKQENRAATERLRQAAEVAAQRHREVHQALYGIPERRDDSGALIERARPGLLASMQAARLDLDSLRAEFPVNGVPARAAIDLANQNIADLRDDVRAIERTQRQTAAALRRQGISVPSPSKRDPE